MSKRYFWLKLKEEFFEDKTIKKLRKIAGGDTYTIIYLKMLLLAIKQENKLYFEGVEENLAGELALELNEEEDNVSVTISYLKSKGLLEVVSEDEFLLPQCEEMVGSETDAARRQRLSRGRKKQVGQGETTLALPPTKETQIHLFERLVENYELSEELKQKIREWLKYKTERKEPYKEQGMKSLLKKIEKQSQNYGSTAICNLIEDCMSNNWKGIIWEKMEKNAMTNNSIQSRVSKVDNW